MTLLHLSLIGAAFSCSLIAGLLLGFALVVMPGIRCLNDRDFIRTFQVIDRVIQGNQPIFMLLWVGSVISIGSAALLSFWTESLNEWWMVVLAALVYMLGVQVPTVAINVPLNNGLQAVDVENAPEAALIAAREGFEARWNRWNVIRTWCASATSLLLLILLLTAP
jgi:uncharacterized membrane protein